jgi:hypothetical protein
MERLTLRVVTRDDPCQRFCRVPFTVLLNPTKDIIRPYCEGFLIEQERAVLSQPMPELNRSEKLAERREENGIQMSYYSGWTGENNGTYAKYSCSQTHP